MRNVHYCIFINYDVMQNLLTSDQQQACYNYCNKSIFNHITKTLLTGANDFKRQRFSVSSHNETLQVSCQFCTL
jgi:hypothetical protein